LLDWVTWTAILTPVPYGASRLLWAVGIPVGIDGEGLRREFEIPGWGSLYVLLLVSLTEGTGLYTHVFVRSRAGVVPGWIPLLRGRRVRPWLVAAPLVAPIAILWSFNQWSLQYVSDGFAMPPHVAEGMPAWSFWGQVAIFWTWGLSLTTATAGYLIATRRGFGRPGRAGDPSQIEEALDTSTQSGADGFTRG
jgi:hypothetical protein